MVGNHKSLLELRRELRDRKDMEWQEMMDGKRVWPGGDKMQWPIHTVVHVKSKKAV